MINLFIKSVASFLPYEVNPRVIEFGLNYLSKTKKQMSLTSDEIEVTKKQIIKSIKNPMVEKGVAHSNCLTYDGNITMVDWFEHETLGLVGGFNYVSTISEDGSVVCECIDTWDFNVKDSNLLYIKSNPKVIKLAEKIASKLGVKVKVRHSKKGGDSSLSVDEAQLVSLNKERCFQTKWQVIFTAEEVVKYNLVF